MSLKAIAILPSTLVVVASAYSAIKGLLSTDEAGRITDQVQTAFEDATAYATEAFEAKYLDVAAHFAGNVFSSNAGASC